MDSQEERLTRIETKLMYIEDFMNKLQTNAVEQTVTIDHLKTENRGLRIKISELEDSLQDIPNIRPPHY